MSAKDYNAGLWFYAAVIALCSAGIAVGTTIAVSKPKADIGIKFSDAATVLTLRNNGVFPDQAVKAALDQAYAQWRTNKTSKPVIISVNPKFTP